MRITSRTNSLPLDMLPNIGSTMLNSRMSRPTYEKGWNIFSTVKPHFAAWLQAHDVDTQPPREMVLYWFADLMREESNEATPSYYAALCGFHDLVEQLIVKHPPSRRAQWLLSVATGGCTEWWAPQDSTVTLRARCRRRCPGP